MLAVVGSLLTAWPLAHAQAPTTRLVETLARDPSHKVRLQAAIRLGSRPGEQAERALTEALGDEHPAVRAAAAISLGKLHATASLPALRRLLSARERLVRDAAKRAIEMIQRTAADMTVSGPGLASTRPRAAVDELLERAHPDLVRCGLRQLKRDPSFSQVTVRFTILPDGRVTGVTLVPPPAEPAKLSRCLRRVLGGLRFPRAEGGDQTITIPLRVEAP